MTTKDRGDTQSHPAPDWSAFGISGNSQLLTDICVEMYAANVPTYNSSIWKVQCNKCQMDSKEFSFQTFHIQINAHYTI